MNDMTSNNENSSESEDVDERLRRSVELTLGVIIALLNIMEIILILRLKRKKKIFEIVLLSLSVADLLFGLSNASVCVVFLGNWKGESVFDVTYTSYFFFVLTSIFHLVFIAMDRLAAIVRPIRHNISMTRRKVYIFLGVIWIAAIATTLGLYLSNDRGYLFENKSIIEEWKAKNRTKPPKNLLIRKGDTYRTLMQELLSYFILTADFILVIVYVIIIYKVQINNNKNVVRGNEHRGTQIKVSLLCVFVAVSFVVFTIPYAINRLATKSIQFWANIVLVSNSGMNSVIYFFRNYCQQRADEKKRKKVNTSSGLTPMSTPLASRSNIIELAHNSPHMK